MNESSPTSSPSTLRSWLELSRISNLPTVWSNVLVGVALGWGIVGVPRGGIDVFFDPAATEQAAMDVDTATVVATIAINAFAISCFYIAGMILNDVIDQKIDKVERPSRPLPSGRIKRLHAVLVVQGLFVVGLLSLFLLNDGGYGFVAGMILIVAIVAYDVLHKKSAVGVLIMGLCRGLVYLAVAVPMVLSLQIAAGNPILLPPHFWLFAVLITFYTMALTIVARSEAKTGSLDRRKWLAIAIPVVVLMGGGLSGLLFWPATTINLETGIVIPNAFAPSPLIALFAVELLVWLAITAKHVLVEPPRTIKAILGWLSGMCLVDAFFLSILGFPMLAWFAVGCFTITTLGHRRILGT